MHKPELWRATANCWCWAWASELQVSGLCINTFYWSQFLPYLRRNWAGNQQESTTTLLQVIFCCPDHDDYVFCPSDTVFHGIASLQHSENAIQVIPALSKFYGCSRLTLDSLRRGLLYCRPGEPSARLSINKRRTLGMIRINQNYLPIPAKYGWGLPHSRALLKYTPSQFLFDTVTGWTVVRFC